MSAEFLPPDVFCNLCKKYFSYDMCGSCHNAICQRCTKKTLPVRYGMFANITSSRGQVKSRTVICTVCSKEHRAWLKGEEEQKEVDNRFCCTLM